MVTVISIYCKLHCPLQTFWLRYFFLPSLHQLRPHCATFVYCSLFLSFYVFIFFYTHVCLILNVCASDCIDNWYHPADTLSFILHNYFYIFCFIFTPYLFWYIQIKKKLVPAIYVLTTNFGTFWPSFSLVSNSGIGESINPIWTGGLPPPP